MESLLVCKSLSQVIQHHSLGTKVKDFFIAYKSKFGVNETDELYVTIFDNEQVKLGSGLSNLPQQLKPSKINSRDELEQVIKNFLINLTFTERQKSHDVILAGKFSLTHGISITEQLRQLEISGNFIKFLQSCSSLKIHRLGERWEVVIKK